MVPSSIREKDGAKISSPILSFEGADPPHHRPAVEASQDRRYEGLETHGGKQHIVLPRALTSTFFRPMSKSALSVAFMVFQVVL